MTDVLEDQPDDATPQILADEDEQIELVALAWVGRGTFAVEDWNDAIAEARRAHNKRTAEYLFSLPMLGDYLEEGCRSSRTKTKTRSKTTRASDLSLC